MPRIETGHKIMADVQVVKDGDKDAQKVRFVTDDGRTMFEVGWNEDGRSIDVRGVRMFIGYLSSYGRAMTVTTFAYSAADKIAESNAATAEDRARRDRKTNRA